MCVCEKRDDSISIIFNLKPEMDKHTWIKWYPLVISFSKCFGIKLGTLMLFEANTRAGTSLEKDVHYTSSRC